ncbi:MAG: SDR family NAD(P)-dependent oxidoreductase [Proteobacteria bacterium]|nr:SDR family NAD(P)-dependent oxidoreductase [Pseudomonadota bacterium]
MASTKHARQARQAAIASSKHGGGASSGGAGSVKVAPAASSDSSVSRRRSILITGCGSGIGEDCARYFHSKGWVVLATCRTEADAKRLSREGLTSFRLDYEDEASVIEGYSRGMQLVDGRLDVLFNNGAYGVPALVEDLPTDALRQIFEANLFGWHTLTRLAVADMVKNGTGRIIQNSSVLGFVALPVRGAYNATKYALEGLTDTLRLEMRGTGVDVVLIEPGPIRTKIRQNSYKHFQKWIDWRTSRRREFYEGRLIPRLAAKPATGRLRGGELLPRAVTLCVWKAATEGRPRLRYRVTRATKVMAVAKRVLSGRMVDWMTKGG